MSLIARARNAVFWCRMIEGEPASYAEISERGLRHEVERLEALYNEGRPFEEGQLRPGPAPGVMKRVAEMKRNQKLGATPQAVDEGNEAPGSSNV